MAYGLRDTVRSLEKVYVHVYRCTGQHADIQGNIEKHGDGHGHVG